jgi:hypothetical protein
MKLRTSLAKNEKVRSQKASLPYPSFHFKGISNAPPARPLLIDVDYHFRILKQDLHHVYEFNFHPHFFLCHE